MVSVRILIEGERVQGVGYRIFLLRKAFECGIRNLYARNVDADKVEALVSDEEYKVDGFYEALEKEKPKEAIVKYVRREPYNNRIPIPPTIDFLHLLTFEELSEGREELVKLRDEIMKLPDEITGLRGEIVGLRGEITEKLPDRIVDAFMERALK